MIDLANESILVTGGRGFLGAHVLEVLTQRGATHLFVLARSDVDLTDQGATYDYFDAERPDVVIHLAAEVGGIGANQQNPGRFFYGNMAMGLNVVEGARQAGSKKVVVVGTVCAYPAETLVPFSEGNLWNGYPEPTNAPYGVAKRSLATMLTAYREQYGMNGIYLLPANLYGPGDSFDLQNGHVIPALIRKLVEAKRTGDDVTVWGTGAPSREFLHVRDAAEAIVLAAEIYDSPNPVNIGTGDEITIKSLVELISDIVGYEGRLIWDHSRPDGQLRRSLDVQRAKDQFGFTAQVKLEDGLRETIEWWTKKQDADT